MKLKVSRNPDVNWANDSIQFPRLIGELEAMGVFTKEVINDLCSEMDLAPDQVCTIIARAQASWDFVKSRTHR